MEIEKMRRSHGDVYKKDKIETTKQQERTAREYKDITNCYEKWSTTWNSMCYKY